MTAITDAFPELNRVRQFFPLGVENPRLLTRQQIDHYNILSSGIDDKFFLV